MPGHFGDRPIPGWTPPVKRNTVHPERIGKKPKEAKSKDAEKVDEYRREQLRRDAYHREKSDPNPKD